jgi:hypothetical protein
VQGKRAVEADEAKEYAREAGIIYMDTSAKTGLNVKEVFVAIGACGRARGQRCMPEPILMMCVCACAYAWCAHGVADRVAGAGYHVVLHDTATPFAHLLKH